MATQRTSSAGTGGEILVGFDGRDGARTALGEATALAKELGAPLVVVFAYHVSPLGGEVQDLHDALIERGRAVTAEAVAAAGEQGVDARAELVHGEPAPAMVELAERLGARLIVVGSTGEGPLKGALVGSTPHKLIQLSPVPVLVVRV
jgi:nucleotide-binding universal stress UspA family protein